MKKPPKPEIGTLHTALNPVVGENSEVGSDISEIRQQMFREEFLEPLMKEKETEVPETAH